MKKKIIFSAFLVLTLVFLSGCTSSEGEMNSNTASTNQVSQPEGEADLSGIIRSVVGNEFVVAKLDLSEMGGEGMMPNGEMPEGEMEESDDAAVLSFGSTGGMPGGGQGGGPDGGGPGGMMGEDDSDDATTELLRQSTENVIVTIPVGIQITKGAESLTISDLAAGDMLTIWFDDSVEGRNVAKYVQVR